MTEQVTLAVPHHNRFIFMLQCIEKVIFDERIAEIVISDDFSTDGSYDRLQEYYRGIKKVKFFQNERNLNCYKNKARAVSRASSEWVILFDDDNIMSKGYLDAIYRCLPWNPQTAYCPEFASPLFDYREFSGLTVDRANIRKYACITKFRTALNTCNYFVNKSQYLRVWDGSVDPSSADSMFQNYNWLRRGNRLMFVPGLHYFHRVHEKSHFKKYGRANVAFARALENRLKLL